MNAIEKRSDALKWWALLSQEEREYYAMKRFSRLPASLTGREIQELQYEYV